MAERYWTKCRYCDNKLSRFASTKSCAKCRTQQALACDTWAELVKKHGHDSAERWIASGKCLDGGR